MYHHARSLFPGRRHHRESIVNNHALAGGVIHAHKTARVVLGRRSAPRSGRRCRATATATATARVVTRTEIVATVAARPQARRARHRAPERRHLRRDAARSKISPLAPTLLLLGAVAVGRRALDVARRIVFAKNEIAHAGRRDR